MQWPISMPFHTLLLLRYNRIVPDSIISIIDDNALFMGVYVLERLGQWVLPSSPSSTFFDTMMQFALLHSTAQFHSSLTAVSWQSICKCCLGK